MDLGRRCQRVCMDSLIPEGLDIYSDIFLVVDDDFDFPTTDKLGLPDFRT